METRLCAWADCHEPAYGEKGRWCAAHLAEQIYLRSYQRETPAEAIAEAIIERAVTPPSAPKPRHRLRAVLATGVAFLLMVLLYTVFLLPYLALWLWDRR